MSKEWIKLIKLIIVAIGITALTYCVRNDMDYVCYMICVAIIFNASTIGDK